MSQERARLERQLKAGIRAARAGNTERARELLTGVLRIDRSNELAWIWLGQAVNTRQERRRCLEEVLKINPGNRPARAALNQLVGVVGSEGATFDVERIAAASRTQLSTGEGQSSSNRPATSRPSNSGGPSRGISPLLLGLGGVAALLIALLLITVVPLITGNPEPTPTAIALEPTATLTPLPVITDPATGLIITETPTPTPIIPTATIMARATRAPDTNLQPTFTPTDTSTPTETPLPTATLPPLDGYVIYYTAETSGVSALYRMRGDGSQNVQLANNIIDFAISADGQRIAFTREVAYGAGTAADGTLLDASTGVELFLSSLADVATVQQLTNVRNATISSPTFILDQQQIAYASDEDGDNDLYRYDLLSSAAVPLTFNDREDLDPHWSALNEQIVFVSDVDSVGNPSLYTYSFFEEEGEEVSQLANSGSDSLDPRWSPDGDSLAFVSDRGVLNIQVVDSRGRSFRSLTNSVSAQYAPVWSPDGNYIAHATDTGSTFSIDLLSVNGRMVMTIPLPNQRVRTIAFLPN